MPLMQRKGGRGRGIAILLVVALAAAGAVAAGGSDIRRYLRMRTM